ncbi:MAG: uracil-DNA glycosylase [Candidatus Thermoplasmatota archaeon]|jgi:DNA polymerase|nr:uracil-DNA glycosylase [Candidatus Thermoplasmatota archaeon]MCL5955051.1 uracil-DNA glycosylase [Candidatus Thermoplasmatota archaeon]
MVTLGELCVTINTCKKCDLYFSRKNPVCGFGNHDPKLMILGEAPGAREDELGKPFVGRSGKLLDSALEYAGLKKHEIYISNSVKCRPKIGRAPKVHEIKQCSDYLREEIGLLKPRIIVPMGNAAIKSVGHIFGISFGRISEVQGDFIFFNGTYFAPQFHPAAILRDPKKLEKFKDNFQRVAAMVDEIPVYSHEEILGRFKIRKI